MKYVRKLWLPVLLLIAFIAAAIYTTRTPYPIDGGNLEGWVAERHEGFLPTLGVEAVEDDHRAAALDLSERTHLEVWQFRAGGELFNDVMVWRSNGEGGCKLVFSQCIAQSMMDGPMEVSVQEGLYRYQCQVSAAGEPDGLTSELAILPILLTAALAVGYVALTVGALYYRRKEKEKEAAKE